MQTKCPIFLTCISVMVLMALCMVALLAVGYPLSRYEYRSWKESVSSMPVVNSIESQAAISLECLGLRCQQHGELLWGRGPPEQIDSDVC